MLVPSIETRLHGLPVLRRVGSVLLALVLVGPALTADDASTDTAGGARLFFLDIRGARVLTASPDDAEPIVLVGEAGRAPDGIAIDPQEGWVYWTNMGRSKENDGALRRARLDGSEVQILVASGGTHTPKQLQIDTEGRKLYWADREGMRVMRSNLDGTEIETLVTLAEGDAARADAANWGVGIALDPQRRHVYWTQKGGSNADRGSIRRVAMAVAPSETSRHREIEILFDRLPEPIDLAIDLEAGLLYWTDRGDNTVNRAGLDLPAGATPRTRRDREILVTGLDEAIGIALDLVRGEMYYTDLGGNIGRSELDGSNATTLFTGQGVATGITVVGSR